MTHERLSGQQWIERVVIAILFAGIGSLIIIVFSQYRPLFSGSQDLIGRIGLLTVLLAAALLARRSGRFERYWQLIFGLFVMASAVSLDLWIAHLVQGPLEGMTYLPARFAVEKLKTVTIVAVTVILLTRLSGSSLGSIYIQKGNLKSGLTIGLIAFGIAAAGSIPMSQIMFTGGEVSLAEVLRWSPWILIFVLGNATNEELLFRGLFLRKLEPFYGRFLSNCLVVLVFTGLHLGVTYTRDQMIFLIVVVPVALAWGYIMQKTDSIWGSILFHAGMDLPIIIGLLSGI